VKEGMLAPKNAQEPPSAGVFPHGLRKKITKTAVAAQRVYRVERALKPTKVSTEGFPKLPGSSTLGNPSCEGCFIWHTHH